MRTKNIIRKKSYINIVLILAFTLWFPNKIFSQNIEIYNYGKTLKALYSVEVSLGADVHLYKPYSLSLLKDYLILTDTSNEPSVSVFKVLNDSSMSLIESIGREGKGPGEYLSPWNIITGSGSDLFYIYDAGLRRITPYNADFELISNEIINLKIYGVYIDLFRFKDVFIASGITPGCRFEKVDTSGEIIDCIGMLPELNIDGKVNERSLAQRWHVYSVINPDKNKIALFYRHAARGTLMTLDGEVINNIIDSKLGFPQTEIYNGNVIGGKNDLRAYISITSNDNFIYALYSGRVSSSPSSFLGTYVHKFDWDLNLLDIYELDHSAIQIAMVDENRMYTIEYEPEPKIRFVALD